jgi:hypothetical protein
MFEDASLKENVQQMWLIRKQEVQAEWEMVATTLQEITKVFRQKSVATREK